jgi:hypothetical protein
MTYPLLAEKGRAAVAADKGVEDKKERGEENEAQAGKKEVKKAFHGYLIGEK